MPHRDDLEADKFELYSDYSVRMITTEHARIHEGKAFIAGGLFSVAADGTSIEMLLQLTNSMHAIMQIAAGGDCEIHVFEDTEFSSAGVSLSAFNKNRYSSVVSGTVFTHTPTITSDGTELPPTLLAGGSGGNANGGTSGGFNREMILNGTKNYLVRVTNISGKSISISSNIEWYEPSAE